MNSLYTRYIYAIILLFGLFLINKCVGYKEQNNIIYQLLVLVILATIAYKMLFANSERFTVENYDTVNITQNGNNFDYARGYVCLDCGYCVLSNRLGTCPITNKPHNLVRDGEFAVLMDTEKTNIEIKNNSQKGWVHCDKCYALHWGDSSDKKNACINGTKHNISSQKYFVPVNLTPEDKNTKLKPLQDVGYIGTSELYWCAKCDTMHHPDAQKATCMIDKQPHITGGSGVYSFAVRRVQDDGLNDYMCIKVGNSFVPVRKNENGEIECWANDGQNCAWSDNIDTCNNTIKQKPLKPIMCEKWQYDIKDHWCEKGKTQLTSQDSKINSEQHKVTVGGVYTCKSEETIKVL